MATHPPAKGRPVTTKSTPALNSVAARRLLANIERDLNARLRKTKTDDPLEAMLSKAKHVLSVALMPSRPDGFPSTTPGNGNPGGGSGRFIVVPDEKGYPERVPVTTTEQAVMTPNVMGDPIGAIAREVLAELATMQASLQAIDNALNRFDNLRNQVTETAAPYCYVARHIHKLPWDEKWETFRRTDFRGMFTEPQPVCQFVYYFHRDNGRLPTEKEMRTYLEKQVVRIHAS